MFRFSSNYLYLLLYVTKENFAFVSHNDFKSCPQAFASAVCVLWNGADKRSVVAVTSAASAACHEGDNGRFG